MNKTFLFIVFFFTTYSFSQSPTKEQTIDFLKSYYDNKGKMSCEDLNYPTATSNSFKVLSINEIGNCEYKIIWEWDYNYKNVNENLKDFSYKKYTVVINFNKVEELRYSKTKRGDCNLYYIKIKGTPGVKFSVTNESESYGKKDTRTYSDSEILIPANFQYSDGGEIFAETEKIFKAFNHLRKLCGAPEPIKFD